MKRGYVWIDRDDPTTPYLEIRLRWPMSLAARRRRRAWRKYARTLPPGANLTQIISPSAFDLTRSVRPKDAS